MVTMIMIITKHLFFLFQQEYIYIYILYHVVEKKITQEKLGFPYQLENGIISGVVCDVCTLGNIW